MGPLMALELVALRQQIDRLELRFSQLAAAFKATEHWEEEGSNSAIDWIRFNCRMTSNAAADRIAVGGGWQISPTALRRWRTVRSALLTSP